MKRCMMILALVLAGCQKKDGHADNAATRYGAALAESPQKAHVAVDKANAAVAEQNDRMKEAEGLGN
jgi:hypothetical protein